MTDDDREWPPPPVVFGGPEREAASPGAHRDRLVEEGNPLPPPFVAPGAHRMAAPAAEPVADPGMALPADAVIHPDDPIIPQERGPDPAVPQELKEEVFPLLEVPDSETKLLEAPDSETKLLEAPDSETELLEEPDGETILLEEPAPEARLQEELHAEVEAPAEPGAAPGDALSTPQAHPVEEVAALLERMAAELRAEGSVRFHLDEESSRLESLLRGMLAGYLARREGDGG
jgi:hypothetical protein